MLPTVDFYLNDFRIEQARPIELALFSSRTRRLEGAAFACEQSSLAFGALAQVYEPGMDQRVMTESFWGNLLSIRNAIDAAKAGNMLTDPAEERITEVLREIEEALKLTKKSVADLQAKDVGMNMPFFHTDAVANLRGVSDFFAELSRERKKMVFHPTETFQPRRDPWASPEMRPEQSKPY